MRARSYLVAAALGTLTSLVAAPSLALADDDEDEFEGDGPEAEAVELATLDQLIEYAFRQAPDISRAKLDRSAAKGKAGAARADQQWTMQMGATYKRNAIGGQVDPGPFGTVAQDAIHGVLGLGRKLPTGARLDLELGIAHIKTEYNIPDELREDFGGMTTGTAPAQQPTDNGGLTDKATNIQTTARVTLKQPLVRGFGPDVALAPEKRADFEYAAETIKAQLAAEDTVREIVATYWELAYAAYTVDTRAEAVALAEAQEKLTREEVRAGKTPQNQLNAVTYEIAVRKEAHLTAQIDAEKKSLDLRRKVGLGLGRREVVLRPKEALEIGDAEWDIDDVIAQSRKANRKLATIALQKKVADIDVKVAKNGILPQVDVSLSGALIGGGPTTGQSFSAIGGAEGYEVMAGLSVSFELSGAARAAADSATARRRRLDVDRLDYERQIEAEVVTSVKTVTAATARVALSDKAISVGEENARAERLNFTAGKTTNYSVMQRQSELIEARLRRGRAVADYYVAVAQLQYLSGTLLEQYRINVRPRSRR